MIADRESWGGLSPRKTTPMPHPILYIRYTLDSGTPMCKTDQECREIVKQLQKEDMDKGLDDIRYNFLLSDDGTVYEGRGWFSKPPFEEYYGDYDGKYMEIAFIGNYSKISRSDKWHESKMNAKGMELIYYAIENGYLSRDFKYLPLETIEELKAKGIDKPEIEPVVPQKGYDKYGFAPGEVEYIKDTRKNKKPEKDTFGI